MMDNHVLYIFIMKLAIGSELIWWLWTAYELIWEVLSY